MIVSTPAECRVPTDLTRLSSASSSEVGALSGADSSAAPESPQGTLAPARKEDRERLCHYLFIAGVQFASDDPTHFSSERNAAGRAARLKPTVRSMYPDRRGVHDELARWCFPHGVLPSPKPQPMTSFVTAVTAAGGTGERFYLHVLLFPERYGTRLWVPACIAVAVRGTASGQRRRQHQHHRQHQHQRRPRRRRRHLRPRLLRHAPRLLAPVRPCAHA